MTYRFALDKDGDVRSFVMGFVNNEILEKQREKDNQAAAERTKEEMMETTPITKDGEDDIMSDVEERK